MASLNKLAIRGIRSFDDKRVSVIEFFTPVTVIVGHNGSGKTTIIECLKYATTGDQPPNTRGGAFIHDPKMANEKEVKAQVKLRFHAANGQRMLAVRNLSVSLKKTGALQMKTLESILGLADEATEKMGKRAVISTKCAEMDIEIPRLLGVSKAVLENVIFCHQEDSYWPLSEPATLKRKFDDIFEATKYTKALDSIKALRKDRVAELKAEKERLEGLSREKAHADKLRGRISDLTSDIAGKEVEYEETRQEYDLLVAANQKFYDSATKFREIFIKVENLQNEKLRYQEELATAKETLQEMAGTDEELADRLRNFDNHMSEQKRKRKREEDRLQDVEDELQVARKSHADKLTDRGQLEAEAKAQEQRLMEREAFIRELSSRHHLSGYDHSPLEREKVLEFISRLSDMKNRQNTETEDIQHEYKTKSEEYNAKVKQLHGELAGYKSQKDSGKARIATLNSTIDKSMQQVDAADELTSQAKVIEADIEEKERRLKKVREEIKAANYEARSAEFSAKAHTLDAKRAELDKEFTSLNLQADSRARLDLKREALRSKTSEVKNLLEINSAKFRRLVGLDARAETMEREAERVSAEKERELAEVETLHGNATKELSAVETALSNAKDSVRNKEQELKKLSRKIDDVLQEYKEDKCETVEQAMEVAKTELAGCADFVTTENIFNSLLGEGKTKKCCPFCVRSMTDREISTFERSIKDQLSQRIDQQASSDDIAVWKAEVQRLQELAVVAADRDKLQAIELPALRREITEKEGQLPEASSHLQQVSQRLEDIKKDMRDLSLLKQSAAAVSRAQKEIQALEREIASLETELLSTGSAKTVEDVQSEIDVLKGEQTAVEREKQSLAAERERQLTAARSLETDMHHFQLDLSEVKSKLRDKSALEKRIVEMRQEITSITAQLQTIDTKISDAEPVVQRLELEFRQAETELGRKISEAQRASQELNMNVDKLEGFNRSIERYVRDKRARHLKETVTQIEDLQAEIHQLAGQLEEIRTIINGIDKDIGAGDASMANLRENLRVRKLVKEIAATQAQIDSYDVEEAAKARRIFQEKYQKEKDRETELQGKYAHIGGELSSLKQQLREQEVDMREFKDINRRYRDQLIKVKMSDMANNDLEKYAKALDNAIMKYHGLKMEEVNDTMRHLWNKTYQGTDIDGIKISSDSEGGATKRSYNYRVVMTKDNVEMDMRGRCSAGQKMLASIIIRLALADSFGQNCGILALDEPTNALDTENIDALAASLIDIIEERKKQANFQLIIITHDENFLRKLGQSNVMEHYWRVSRDARQKSIIERHRFG